MRRLLMMGAMVLVMASCSKDMTNSGQGGKTPAESELSRATYRVGGGDQSRVKNYASSGSSVTRSISDFQEQTYPEIPTDAVDVTGFSENDLRNAGPNIKITGEHTGKINSWNNQTLYIAQGAKVKCAIEGNIKVYILEGASLTFDAGNISSVAGIYNWGEFTSVGDFSLNDNLFYSAVPVSFNGILTFPSNAKYYCKETTYAKGLNINSNAKIESCAFVINADKNDPNYLREEWGSYAWNATGIINFQGGNVEIHTSWISNAGCINFNSNNNLHLTLEDHGRIDTEYLKIDPKQNDQKIVTLGSMAVVCASYVHLYQNFQQNEARLLPNFGEGVYLQDVTYIRENGQDNYDLSPYTIPVGAVNAEGVSMTGNKCSPGYGSGPTLEPVADVKSMTHDHDADKDYPKNRRLSATSLTFDEKTKNIYVSYHMRGGNWAGDTYDKDDIEGCIERWTLNDDGEIEIGNWMWTNEFDFNHILFDNDYVITVGHKGGEKKIKGSDGQEYTDFGGIIGRMPTGVWAQNWDAEDDLTREDFVYKYLTTEVPVYDDYTNPKKGTTTKQLVDYESAGDGNCVIRVGNEYFVATSKGYGKINAADFKRVKDENGDVLFTSTPGSAKYLVKKGDMINVLYLNDRPKESSTQITSFGATLATMGVDAFPTGETTEKAMAANVSPVDGKNVIAVDDDGTVYACLSMGGLQVGDKIVKEPFGEERAVNGVAVYGNYVYVANGNYITVLNKSTLEKVVEARGGTEDDKISANFVEVKEYNNEVYVFVAFGQNGIKVFKFKE